jgi:dipeptidyl-peptidase-4
MAEYHQGNTMNHRSTISVLAMCAAGMSICLLAACAADPGGRAATASVADPASGDPSLLTMERIFAKHETPDDFRSQPWGPARWHSDGSGYATVDKSATITDESLAARDIVHYDAATGRREILVRAEGLIPAGETAPLKISSYSWSDDGGKLLIFTNSKRVWRYETRGDYWVYDLKAKTLRKLGSDAEPATLMFAAFSPNGRQVAYVCKNNLYVQSLDEGFTITPLTTDGSPTIINGTSDWVYEEEFYLRSAFRWSPDGEYIAYWQFDTSEVREFKLINYTDSLYPVVTSFAYPKVGETNSACHVGVVRSTGGPTRWFSPNADARNHYIPRMEWTKDSRHVIFQQLNRLQNKLQVIRGDITNSTIETLFTDQDAAWVDVADNKWVWLDQGRSFLWISERDGWQRIYSVSCSDKKVTPLTPATSDAMSIAGVDEKLGCVYFIASPDDATQRHLYRAPLDGSGKAERVSPAQQPGNHAYDISSNGRWAFHTYSRFGQPPVTELISLPDHTVVRVLVDNAKLKRNIAALQDCPSEFFRVDIGGGVQCDAWCIKPPQFNAARKYPLLIHVYGEPAATTVEDKWGDTKYLWHRLLAQQGYVVMCIENRGTPAPRGREWRKCIYRQIGILACEDQAAAVRQILKDRPYLDPARVGIWGWSGGGSMSLNAIFRHPDLYRTAMAIAFVANQRFYDTIYQERYMGLPESNPDGYLKGSPITHAHQLQGNLLLVYGTGDDNCHYQNCEVLINELIKHNKQFLVMPYPNRTHAIREGDNTTRHLYETLTRYLNEHLPVGP